MYTKTETKYLGDRSISLCICTMNRATDLNLCLKSVFQCSQKPDEVIISDDSLDPEPTKMVVACYPGAAYQQGPRRGLGSNRNACIQSARGSHIVFIDDDVLVPPEFFVTARKLITSSNSKTIITGHEINHKGGDVRKVVPHNSDFWGLQRLPVDQEYCSLVINSTIFPRSLFERALFDENLRYGSEEIDIARHAVSLGYQIEYQDCLYVEHYPSPINREQYCHFSNASRLYATTKAYWQYERSLLKTLAYVSLAPIQLVGHQIKTGQPTNVLMALQSIFLASKYVYSNFWRRLRN